MERSSSWQSSHVAPQAGADETRREGTIGVGLRESGTQRIEQRFLPMDEHERIRRQLAALVETSRDIICVASLDGRVLYLNDTARALFGDSAQITEVLFPDDIEMGLRVIETAAREGRWMGEICLRKKNSSEPLPVWCDVFALAEDGSGAPDAIAAVARDVREQKRSEEHLRAVEARLRLALQTTHVGAWEHDPQSGDVCWDERCQALFGFSIDDPVDMPRIMSAIHPDDRERVQAALRRALDSTSRGGNGNYMSEYRVVGLRDGIERWVLAQGKAFFDEHGRAVRFVGTLLDITERKETEICERLLAEVSAVLASSLDIRATLSAALRLVVQSHAFAQLATADLLTAGMSEPRESFLAHEDPALERELREQRAQMPLVHDDLLREPSVITAPPAVIHISPELVASVARSPAHRDRLETLALRSVLLVPLISRGRALGVLSFGSVRKLYSDDELELARELSRRLSLAVENALLFEAAQQGQRKAEEASRTKDEFLATVSHELRTPLSAMLGWTRLLRAGALPEAQRDRALEVIERNAQAQARLIEDLLDISRIISGKTRLALEPMSLASVMDAALDAVRPAAEAKGIALVADLQPSAELITCDPDRIQQVVWNLLSNAVKFTPQGGKVVARLRREDDHYELQIEDDGQGIEPMFLSQVFDRFRQADGSVTRQHSGLGLGLAIVKHLVELHGGTVSAESEGRGKGARFRVFLPTRTPSMRLPALSVPPSSPHADAPNMPRGAALKGVRILVVDDAPDARELLVSLLEYCSGEVRAAATGAEALDALTVFRPDVLISDIAMPGMDGYALIRAIRDLPPERGGSTPAIALTAFSRPEDRQRALRDGFNKHVAKPVEPRALLATLVRLLGRTVQVSS